MPPLHAPTAVRLLLLGLAVTLLLAGCGDDGMVEPPGDTDPTDEVDPTPTPDELASPTDDDPEGGGTDGSDDDTDRADPDDGTEPLSGEPSTEEQREDPERGDVAVIRARVAAHDGFDRVVLDIEGDGSAGWWTSYVDEARSAGKGDVIDIAGQAVLSVGVQGATLPPDLPESIEPWINDRRPGDGGVVTEVVSGTIFEGVHNIFIGLDQERPFLIERFEDPQRIVIDILHD